jgi:hypothetical protein
MPSFMDNLLRQAGSIKNRGVFGTPISGDRKLPSCATRDIAAVAARLLLDHSWSGAGHVAVLGPEDLSFTDMAQIMSEALGKPVRYQADTGPGPQGQAHRGRDVRRDGPGHSRHDGRQGPGPRQRRTAHPRNRPPHHLPPVVPGEPSAVHRLVRTVYRADSPFTPIKDTSPDEIRRPITGRPQSSAASSRQAAPPGPTPGRAQ